MQPLWEIVRAAVIRFYCAKCHPLGGAARADCVVRHGG